MQTKLNSCKKYEVLYHFLGHHHPLAHGDLGHYLPSEQNMFEEKAMKIEEMHTSGISIVET